LEAFDDLVGRTDEPERFAAFREMLGEQHCDDTKLLEEQLSWTAKEVHAAQERFKEANMSNGAAFKFIEPGLLDSYKRGRRAMSSAYDKPEETAFHEWRKRVKDLGYQMQTYATFGLLSSNGSEVNSTNSATCSAKSTI
jgi:hypothetical protein